MDRARRETILDMLKSNGSVTLRELQTLFPDYSVMTLRRDLEFFENVGEAVRVRGGAEYTGIRRSVEDIYELRESKNLDSKEHIAALAVPFAKTGCSLFIDSGSTGMCLARLLPDAEFSVVTNGINVATELMKKFKPFVTVTGGHIDRSTLSVSGSRPLSQIKELNIDIAFVVASAFSLENGFTAGNSDECEMKKEVVGKAKKTVLLADSDKFGKSMFFTFAQMGDVDIIVTDKKPSPAVLSAAEQAGTKIIW